MTLTGSLPTLDPIHHTAPYPMIYEMSDTINPLDLPASPSSEMLTVSPADTSLDTPEPEDLLEDGEKKPTKKRKSWGQELPVPKTNLPPRYVPILKQKSGDSSPGG